MNKRKNNPRMFVIGLSGIAVLLLLLFVILRNGIFQEHDRRVPVIANQDNVSDTKDSTGNNEYEGNSDISSNKDNVATGLSNEDKTNTKIEKNVIPVAITNSDKTSDSKGTLYFVIDDVGNNLEELNAFLELPFPVTLAVMPQRPYTAQALSAIRAAKKPYIIHQPMEPMGEANPGEGAIYTGMPKDEIYDVLDENLVSMPDVLGMNNHMGSKVTSDEFTMGIILEYLSGKKLFFLDSMTTGESKGELIAQRTGTSFMKRNSMFLDNEDDRESIIEMIRAGQDVAKKEGHAVMIGHVWSNELAGLLLELYPSLLEDGFELKDVRDLITKGDIQ